MSGPSEPCSGPATIPDSEWETEAGSPQSPGPGPSSTPLPSRQGPGPSRCQHRPSRAQEAAGSGNQAPRQSCGKKFKVNPRAPEAEREPSSFFMLSGGWDQGKASSRGSPWGASALGTSFPVPTPSLQPARGTARMPAPTEARDGWFPSWASPLAAVPETDEGLRDVVWEPSRVSPRGVREGGCRQSPARRCSVRCLTRAKGHGFPHRPVRGAGHPWEKAGTRATGPSRAPATQLSPLHLHPLPHALLHPSATAACHPQPGAPFPGQQRGPQA